MWGTCKTANVYIFKDCASLGLQHQHGKTSQGSCKNKDLAHTFGCWENQLFVLHLEQNKSRNI